MNWKDNGRKVLLHNFKVLSWNLSRGTEENQEKSAKIVGLHDLIRSLNLPIVKDCNHSVARFGSLHI
jgi:hypothetical protein